MIQIFDNIISKEEQEQIKNCLLGRDFPWFYLDDITFKDGVQKRPAFSHYFVLDEKENSQYNYLTNNIINNSCKKSNIICNKVLETRSFLQLPLHDNVTNGVLTDASHIDRNIKHTVVLYYVMNSDGDTIIYKNNKEHKITPKQGRVVVFDGLLKHTATQPINNTRCIINVNVV